VEVACNLLDRDVTSTADVEEAIKRLAEQRAVRLGTPYVIGKSPEAITQLAREALLL
jgi:hypothetical protein